MLAALRKAAELPLEGISVEWEDTYEHFGSLSAIEIASCATELAYREDQVELCLALCDRWQIYVDHNYGCRSFHVFRAACFLKLGKLADASKEVENASKSNCMDCQGDHVEKLKKAIEVGNRAFRYVPLADKVGSDIDFWDIVIDYK